VAQKKKAPALPIHGLEPGLLGPNMRHERPSPQSLTPALTEAMLGVSELVNSRERSLPENLIRIAGCHS
jgi:hypothetical protein